MVRWRRCLVLALAATALCGAPGCIGISQNPSYFPHWVPFGDIVPTHAKPPGPSYYANFDPRAIRLEVRPLEATNQVRTQHVVLATVYDGPDEKANPVRNRRIEWMVEGVGNILEVDESGIFPGRGYKTGPKHAVSYTARNEHRITRGTASEADDFELRPGQSWCVVSSAVEGDTYVTVYAPGIFNWDKRRMVVNIRWVDAGWEFPGPAQVRGGTEHVLTTKVFRATDRQPLAGYRVRYKIVDGPAAFFLPSRTTEFTATSDLSGNAQATIVQQAAMFGVNNIVVDIIRPPDPTAPSGAGVPIAQGKTQVEWIAPNVQLAHTGPSLAVVGAEVAYTTTVTNGGRIESRSQTVIMPIPEGYQYVRSNPPAFAEGKQLVWALGVLPTGATHNLQTVFRTTRPGAVTVAVGMQTEEGQKDEKAVTTQVSAAALKVAVTGPANGLVGTPINYQISVSNPGGGAIDKVQLTAKFDPGLESPEAARELNATVENLKPGETRNMPLVAIPRASGRLGVKVVAVAGALVDQAEHFVLVQAAGMTMSIDGPSKRYKDKQADFLVKVANPGDAAVSNVIVRLRLPAELGFVAASDKGQFEGGEVVWNLGNLGPRAERTLQLATRPQAIAKNVMLTGSSSADGGIRKDAQAIVEIYGLPTLQTKLTDRNDPVEVGKKVVYTIEVANTGTLPADGIEVMVTVPPQLRLSNLKAPAKEAIAGNIVRFEKVDGLPPSNRLVYELEMEGIQPGDARLRVQITSPALPGGPVIEEESTTVFTPAAGGAGDAAPPPPPPPPP